MGSAMTEETSNASRAARIRAKRREGLVPYLHEETGVLYFLEPDWFAELVAAGRLAPEAARD